MQMLLTITVKQCALDHDSLESYSMTVIWDAQSCAACLQLSAAEMFFYVTCTVEMYLPSLLVLPQHLFLYESSQVVHVLILKSQGRVELIQAES